ncbi:MAG: ATP-binding protein [Trueperaceae bacterium]|nr:ATP-binding protein [Trueperaceae bacterium]
MLAFTIAGDIASSSHPPTLIDRQAEVAELRSLATAGEPRLALLTGRRRVGKTFLLLATWTERQAFAFTASRTSPEQNRRPLLLDLARWSGEPIEPDDHPTWRSVFQLLLDLRAPEPLVVVIDEFQHLAEDERGLATVASELNAAWERRRPPRSFLMVLAGSVVHTMEALAGGGAPLYGRFHWRHHLEPFDYRDAAALAPFDSLRERIEAYAVFGGTPRYLAAVDPTAPLVENAARLSLSPRGEVRQLVETALDQEQGLRDVPKYRAILRAVATGQTRRNEIAQRTGVAHDAGLRDKLARLVDLGYLTARTKVDARPNEAVAYAVADPAVRFHHRFVEPHLALLDREAPLDVWTAFVAPRFAAFVGIEFERVATQAYDRLRRTRGYPLVERWGRWEGRDQEGALLKIDVVAPLIDGRILSGAVKWNARPTPADVHFRHLAMLERAAAAGRAWAHTALQADDPLLYVAAAGFEEGFVDVAARQGRPVIALTLDDLFAD